MRKWPVIVACAVLQAAPLRGGSTELIYASPYGPGHTFSLADKTWIKWVEQHSNGALRIHAVWSGALISSDQSMVELRHGVADIGLITPIYARGGAHLLREQTAFYSGAKTSEQQVAMYRCLAAAFPEYSRELKGLKVLAVQGGTMPGILTRTRAVHGLSDLRGMRVRVPAEVLGVLRDLGADPVTMPMGGVYSDLAKGVLDGVVAPADSLKSLHFGEVARHFTELEVPRGAYPARAMGLERWNSLSAQERAILTESIPIWEAALSKETQSSVLSGRAEGRAQHVEFIPIPAEEQRRFDDLYDRDAEKSAHALERVGIDGVAVFHAARKIAEGIRRTGVVTCPETADAAT